MPRGEHLIPFKPGYDPRRGHNGGRMVRFISRAATLMREILDAETVDAKNGKTTELQELFKARIKHAKAGDAIAFRDVMALYFGSTWDTAITSINIQNNTFRQVTDDEARIIEARLLQPDIEREEEREENDNGETEE